MSAPNTPASIKSNAWRLWEDDKHDEAIPALEQLLQTETDNDQRLEILDSIAYSYAELARYDEALHTYRQLLKITPDDADALANIANILRRQRNWNGALEYYQLSFDKGNTDKDDLMLLANTYWKREDRDTALQVLNVLVNHHSDYAPAYETIGYIEDQRNNYLEAALAYQKTIELGVSSPLLIKRAMFMMLNMRQFEIAKKAFRYQRKHARDDYNNDAEFLYGLAVAEFYTDEIPFARRHVKRAITLQPDFLLAIQLLEKIQD